ncbi:MAG: hypothetical protein JWM32_3246 [Verrucomicrobia bacterium]|nr:hypothetical protein [Verrucomicrobiota bacterium]
MVLWKTFPGFSAVMGLCGSMLVGEIALGVLAYRASESARKRLEHVSRELRTLSTTAPTPTKENAVRIGNELLRLQVLWEERSERLGAGDGAGSGAQRTPLQRAEGFFDIASFVESMRRAAENAAVKLKADERFGFSAYAHDAPEMDDLGWAFLARQIVGRVLGELFQSGADELIGVHRESAPGREKLSAKEASGRVARKPNAEDFFEFDSRLSLRNALHVGGAGFRVSFVGTTTTLREFLQRLAGDKLPVSVGAVEAEPFDVARNRRSETTDSLGEPLVSAPRTRFTVTFESIDLTALLKTPLAP